MEKIAGIDYADPTVRAFLDVLLDHIKRDFEETKVLLAFVDEQIGHTIDHDGQC